MGHAARHRTTAAVLVATLLPVLGACSSEPQPVAKGSPTCERIVAQSTTMVFQRLARQPAGSQIKLVPAGQALNREFVAPPKITSRRPAQVRHLAKLICDAPPYPDRAETAILLGFTYRMTFYHGTTRLAQLRVEMSPGHSGRVYGLVHGRTGYLDNGSPVWSGLGKLAGLHHATGKTFGQRV